jgi:hypothetical protein
MCVKSYSHIPFLNVMSAFRTASKLSSVGDWLAKSNRVHTSPLLSASGAEGTFKNPVI